MHAGCVEKKENARCWGMVDADYGGGKGFIEQSPMTSRRLWRHQRDISEAEGGTFITDQLTFEPVHAARLIGWVMNRVFLHRHKVIMRNLNRTNSL